MPPATTSPTELAAPSKSTKRPISGWLVLDKPFAMTSTAAVAKLRWLYAAQKAGHAGTLDPLATGLLPIALGEATKTVPFVQDGQKRYRFVLVWGAATATDDKEGAVIATSDHRPTADEVQAALPQFTGTILQRPPAFSALKIDGARAYDLARAGEIVELAPRAVTIDALTLLSHDGNEAHFEMACAKGTYVRALARDLATALGTCGHVGALRRTAVGPFTEAEAVTLAELEAAPGAAPGAAPDRDALLLPPAAALVDLTEIAVTPDDAARIRQGGAVLLRGAGAPVALDRAWASFKGEALAVGCVERGQFQPSRVLLGGS